MMYVDKFLKLNCAGDVLNSLGPLKAPTEAIDHSIRLINHVKPRVFKHPNKYTLVDAVAGNGLTAILAAHLLPIKKSIAVKKNLRLHNSYNERVIRFEYNEANIEDDSFWESLQFPYICLGSYPSYDQTQTILRQSNADLTIVAPRATDKRKCFDLSTQYGGKLKYNNRIPRYNGGIIILGVK